LACHPWTTVKENDALVMKVVIATSIAAIPGRYGFGTGKPLLSNWFYFNRLGWTHPGTTDPAKGPAASTAEQRAALARATAASQWVLEEVVIAEAQCEVPILAPLHI
jgi:hypothetical protein